MLYESRYSERAGLTNTFCFTIGKYSTSYNASTTVSMLRHKYNPRRQYSHIPPVLPVPLRLVYFYIFYRRQRKLITEVILAQHPTTLAPVRHWQYQAMTVWCSLFQQALKEQGNSLAFVSYCVLFLSRP